MARYKSYKLCYKLKVIKYKETHNVSQTALKYNIDRNLMRSWVRDKAKIIAQNHKTDRARCVSPREGKFPELEDDLYSWVTEQLAAGNLVSSTNLQLKAEELNTHGSDEQRAFR